MIDVLTAAGAMKWARPPCRVFYVWVCVSGSATRFRLLLDLETPHIEIATETFESPVKSTSSQRVDISACRRMLGCDT